MIKIISGGQTGVDRAGLDVAIELGIPHSGWCPKGRKAEDGAIPVVYQLQETPKTYCKQRTEWNVRDSDGTLILTRGEPTGGTATTIKLASTQGKPCLVLDLLTSPAPETVCTWIEANGISVLNVAGPRESGCPGIHDEAAGFLRQCLAPPPSSPERVPAAMVAARLSNVKHKDNQHGPIGPTSQDEAEDQLNEPQCSG